MKLLFSKIYTFPNVIAMMFNIFCIGYYAHSEHIPPIMVIISIVLLAIGMTSQFASFEDK